jgi:hypothetical protein
MLAVDAQFWDKMEGGFEEKTADDYDINVHVYQNRCMHCFVPNCSFCHECTNWMISVRPAADILFNIAVGGTQEEQDVRDAHLSGAIDPLHRTIGRSHDPEGPNDGPLHDLSQYTKVRLSRHNS